MVILNPPHCYHKLIFAVIFLKSSNEVPHFLGSTPQVPSWKIIFKFSYGGPQNEIWGDFSLENPKNQAFFWNVGGFDTKGRTPGEKCENSLHWTQLSNSQVSDPNMKRFFCKVAFKTQIFAIMTLF